MPIVGLVVVVVFPGCDGTGSGTDTDRPDADVVADVPGDVPPDGASCPRGPSLDGNGCLLPCEDGWHAASNGSCRADCPSYLAADADGACVVPVCPQGWINVESLGTMCVPECPDGFVVGTESWTCAVPRPEGIREDEAGAWLLDCPEGMEVADTPAGCAVVDVGEGKACPDGPWDTSFTGPNPVHVDANSPAGTGDGTQASPYRTINEAIAASGEEVTILLAPGDYNEAVVVQGLKEFNLIGACAARTRIVATGLATVAGVGQGAVTVIDTDVVRIQGLAISSDRKGVAVDHASGGTLVDVSQVRVEQQTDRARSSGIVVGGAYGDVSVSHCSIAHATGVGILVIGDWSYTAPTDSTVVIARNEVQDIDDCVNWAFCPNSVWNLGIQAALVATARITGNHVVRVPHANGAIGLQTVTDSTVEGNVIEDVGGFAGVAVVGQAESAIIDGNRIAGGEAQPVMDSDASSFDGILIGNRIRQGRVRGNLLADLQGAGTWVESDLEPATDGPIDLEVSGNVMTGMAAGVVFSRGNTLALSGNSMTSMRNPLFATAASDVTVEGNQIGDLVTDLHGMPPESGRAKAFTMSACALQTGNLTGKAIFRRNQVEGMPHFGLVEDAAEGICFIGVPSVLVEANLLVGNLTNFTLWASSNRDVTFLGNILLGIDDGKDDPEGGRSAIGITSNDASGPSIVTVRENWVQNYEKPYKGWSVVFFYPKDDVSYTVTGNRFVSLDGVGFVAYSSRNPTRLEYRDNDHLLAGFSSDYIRDVAFEGNRFRGGVVSLFDLPETGVAFVRGNLFEAAVVMLVRPKTAMTVQANQFDGALGVGLLVASSSGTVEVIHNVFNGVIAYDWPAVGSTGEAIQVTGTAEYPSSGVRIDSNLVQSAARSGIVASGTSAAVVGNQYIANGASCGGACDLVIQSEPAEGALTGLDLAFATRPVEPVAVVTVDHLRKPD